MLQFADDTTAVLSDLNSANVLFSLLKEFEKASGLKLNVKKTEAMWIGSLNLEDKCISGAFSLPIKVCSEPYLRSFQYKVLNSILFTNEILFKIGYITSPNCSFCQDTKETRNHVLFTCPFSYSFWMDVIANILNAILLSRQ